MGTEKAQEGPSLNYQAEKMMVGEWYFQMCQFLSMQPCNKVKLVLLVVFPFGLPEKAEKRKGDCSF